MTEVLDAVAKMNKAIEKMSTSIKGLKTENNELKKENKELKQENRKMDTSIEAIKTSIEALTKKHDKDIAKLNEQLLEERKCRSEELVVIVKGLKTRMGFG